MSATIDVLFTQRFLACAGLYKGELDGQWGAHTQAASDAFDAFYQSGVSANLFDPRSESVIHTLIPVAQTLARKFMCEARASQYTVKLLSGTRTYAEQDALFGQHPKVTNARGGQSNHNFGIAWDVGIFADGVYFTGRNAHEDKAYSDLANLIRPKVPELELGIDWVTFKDAPHYQVKTGKSVSEVRALFEAGKAFV